MANTDLAYGFKPWGPLLHCFPYSVDASNGTACFVNDLIMAESDGNVAPATAGNAGLIGSNQTYLAASTAGTLIVADDPDQRFQAQEDSVGGALAQTNVFNTADHIAGAGSATTKISAHEIDSNTANTTGAGLFLLDIVNRSDNAAGNNAEWICRIAEHFIEGTGV